MALVIEVTLGLLGDEHELGPGGAGAGARIVGRGLNSEWSSSLGADN